MIKKILPFVVIVILGIVILVGMMFGFGYYNIYSKDPIENFSARMDLEVVEGQKYLYEVDQIQDGSIVEFSVSLRNKNYRDFELGYYGGAIVQMEAYENRNLIYKTKVGEKVTETFNGKKLFDKNFVTYKDSFQHKVKAGSYYEIRGFALFYINGKEYKKICRTMIVDLTAQTPKNN